MQIWIGFGFIFSYRLGWILDLRNVTDLGSLLIWSQIWIRVWVHFLLQVGLDFGSEKSHGFGFGFGLISISESIIFDAFGFGLKLSYRSGLI